jgi:hypothetical protein
MFVDLDLGELLSGYPPKIAARECRILTTQNPRYKKKYMEKLQEFLDKHKILERQRAVEDNCRKARRVTKALQDELEEIDRLLLEGRLKAERQCGKLNMKPWSPKLRDQRRVQQHWELWKHQYKTGRDYSEARARLKAEIDNEDPDVPTAEELPKFISKARKRVKEVQKEAKEEREKFLKERAADH